MKKKKVLSMALAATLSAAVVAAQPYAVLSTAYADSTTPAPNGSTIFDSVVNKINADANISADKKAALIVKAVNKFYAFTPAKFNALVDDIESQNIFSSTEKAYLKQHLGLDVNGLKALYQNVYTQLQQATFLQNASAVQAILQGDHTNANYQTLHGIFEAAIPAGITQANKDDIKAKLSPIIANWATTPTAGSLFTYDTTSGKVAYNATNNIKVVFAAFISDINKDAQNPNISNASIDKALSYVGTKVANKLNTINSTDATTIRTLLTDFGLLYTIPTNSGNGGFTPTPSSGTPTVTPSQSAGITPAVAAELSGLTDQLKNIKPTDPAAVKDLTTKAQQAANDALTATPAVGTDATTGAATASLDSTAVKAQIDAITSMIKSMTDAGFKAAIPELSYTVAIPSTVTSNVVAVSLPKDIAAMLAANNIKTVAITVPGGAITVPVSAFAAGQDVKVTVNKLADKDIQKVQTAVATTPGAGTLAPLAAYSYVVQSGNNVVSKFAGTPVTITLTVDSSKYVKGITGVYYIADNGTMQYMLGSSFKDGKITVNSNHLSTYAAANYTKKFKDITAKDWINNGSEKYLDEAVSRLIAKGDTNGNFSPNAKITRAQFTSMVVRALGLENADAKATFNDVKSSAWYANDIAVAKANGIINGVTSTTFEPDATITREQMAKIVLNVYTNKTGAKVAALTGNKKSVFRDFNKVSAWAQDSILALEKLHMIAGSKGMYTPQGSTTKAESVKVIIELVNKLSL